MGNFCNRQEGQRIIVEPPSDGWVLRILRGASATPPPNPSRFPTPLHLRVRPVRPVAALPAGSSASSSAGPLLTASTSQSSSVGNLSLSECLAEVPVGTPPPPAAAHASSDSLAQIPEKYYFTYDATGLSARMPEGVNDSSNYYRGFGSVTKRMDNFKKFVLYVIRTAPACILEKRTLKDITAEFRDIYESLGFEFHMIDLHATETNNHEVTKWISWPQEARGGHQLAAICSAEIKRHLKDAYLIPIVITKAILDTPLIPLTIRIEDFETALQMAKQMADDNSEALDTLNKWYTLDERLVPASYRLNVEYISKLCTPNSENELSKILDIFLRAIPENETCFPTAAGQALKLTLMNDAHEELLSRSIWMHHMIDLPDVKYAFDKEKGRRFNNCMNVLESTLKSTQNIDFRSRPDIAMIKYTRKLQKRILRLLFPLAKAINIKFDVEEDDKVKPRVKIELEESGCYSKALLEDCIELPVMERIESYIKGTGTKPLVIFGKSGVGKSVLLAKIRERAHEWTNRCFVVMRYANLTTMTSNMTSFVTSIVDYLEFISKKVWENSETSNTFERYMEKIEFFVQDTEGVWVILIDSIDRLSDVNDFEFKWLPVDLEAHVRVILTVTSSGTCGDPDRFDTGDRILQKLRERIGDENSFLHLTPFTLDAWESILRTEIGDTDSVKGAVQIPEDWVNSDVNEKILAQAKILRWLAWLGETDLTNTSMANISEKVFDVLEKRFTRLSTSCIISLLLAARKGLLETEIIDLLRNPRTIKGSIAAFWAHFYWIMGPLLLYNKKIFIRDRQLREVARRRYQREIMMMHGYLQTYFKKQSMRYVGCNTQCPNVRKFIELPYHEYKLRNDDKWFASSEYLTDLTWLQKKLHATSIVDLLDDIRLVNLGDSERDSTLSHLVLLKQFLEELFEFLSEKSSEFHSLLYQFIDMKLESEGLLLLENETLRSWKRSFDTGKVSTNLDVKIQDVLSKRDFKS